MSTSWSQGGQPSGPIQNNGNRHQAGSPNRVGGPPPICFKCGNEGHYVVDCPQTIRSTPDGLAASRASDPNQLSGNGATDGGAPSRAQWSNGQDGSVVNNYQNTKNPPVVTRYAVPGQPQQYGNFQGPYGPPTAPPPYQQFSGPAPASQSYPPPQQASYPPHQNQQYGPSGASYSYNQPPQQLYGAPPPNPQYGNQGYQAPQYNNYPQPNGPPPYGGPGYQTQHYAHSPSVPPYHEAPNQYPPQPAYGGPQQPPHWNYTPPVSSPYSASPFQQSRKSKYNPHFKREFSGASRQQSQSQPGSQPDYGSGNYQMNPQATSSNSNLTQYGPNQTSQNLPTSDVHFSGSENVENMNESNASSRTSTPYARRGSTSGNFRKGRIGAFTPFNGNATIDQQSDENEQREEGELSEEDLLEQEFNWELEKIFKEDPPTENVILAQPLATTFDMTPVPLLHLNSAPSVSRYARKDNLNEFTRQIRSQPQWTYLQEDPAFSDANMKGELIPLQEVPAWMAKRHGTVLPSLSRKREWSDEEDRQDNVGIQVKDDPDSEYPLETVPNKRQKKETDCDMSDTIPVKAPGTPTGAPGTPILKRTGTPSFDAGADTDADDVWAPQPGEGALSAPVNEDPTEALLASLGVSGSPKPVRKGSIPPVLMPANDQSISPHGKLPKSMSPQENLGYNMALQNNPSHSNSPHGIPPQGQYNNGGIPTRQSIPYGGPPQGTPPYNMRPQKKPSYGNGRYSIPRQNSYGNGIPMQSKTPYSNAPYSGPPQPQYANSPPYGNGPYGVQQQGMAPHGNPPHGTLSQGHNAPCSNDPSGVLQYNNPTYGTQPHGMSPQGNPAYGVPPQGQYGNGVPPPGNPAYGMPPQGQPPYSNPAHDISPQGNAYRPPNNRVRGNQPARNDSGYASSRGSNSNGLVVNASNQPHSSYSQPRVDGSIDTPSPQEETPVLSECQNSKSDENNESGESPLTPTSAEILGKLIQPARKTSNGKKAESLRQADDTVRKPKRPQPVVAEAYSRRW